MRSVLHRCLRSRLPAVIFLSTLLTLGTAYVLRAPQSIFVLAAIACVSASFTWGYSFHMRREWPRLQQMKRAHYRSVWDSLSSTAADAANAAAGTADEQELRDAGTEIAGRISALVGINRADTVLEIGCGVGRVGWAIAPLCKTWIGCDISQRMLTYAAQRLSQFDNVRFVHLSGATLEQVAEASIDVVYCTNMLAHLDEMERWQYVEEAHRVLRARGRLYMDTIALDSPDGWTMLANNLEQQRLGIQSPYIPLPSTAEEFEAYYRKAGFGAIHTERRGSLLMVTAVKRDARPAFPVEAVAAETA